MLKAGDRVKLTDKVAHTMMRGCTPGGRRKTTVDWYKRRGTIIRRGYNDMAAVQWDGCKWQYDPWALRALEKI